ncbi:hypothetical protein JM83_2900 [Gillisia sp. Hel_I_86]|uniref:Hpt domain-containing protein n=1 Tax=Gillisia sp. Hel_I_86 TaxID=1249981 RepID=UPI00119C09DD|nr:Hpt domain-containing protein [Gillisia sp. Hel_I_86]TVZ27835.1 hypothetical protein JM83_2900 [Gillisia sp. Hel_I_86]
MKEQPTVTEINKICGDNLNYRERLILVIKNELISEVEVYKKNISMENYIECAENVHKLKHKISVLGLEKSYELAVLFEQDLRNSDLKRKNDFDKILKSMLIFTSQL